MCSWMLRWQDQRKTIMQGMSRFLIRSWMRLGGRLGLGGGLFMERFMGLNQLGMSFGGLSRVLFLRYQKVPLPDSPRPKKSKFWHSSPSHPVLLLHQHLSHFLSISHFPSRISYLGTDN